MRISDWSSDVCSSDLMTVSYGHGIAVTPLHLASAYAALANGGIWRPATLLKVKDGEVAKGRRVFRSEERRVGKECAVRVDLGGRRIIKKKKKKRDKRTIYYK